MTVFWMLSTVFALAAIAMGLAATVAAEYVVSAEAQPRARAALDYARLTTAIVCTILLALTPIVLRLRQVPPPRAITVFVLATATVGLGWSLFGESSSPAPKPGEVETISDGP